MHDRQTDGQSKLYIHIWMLIDTGNFHQQIQPRKSHFPHSVTDGLMDFDTKKIILRSKFICNYFEISKPIPILHTNRNKDSRFIKIGEPHYIYIQSV